MAVLLQTADRAGSEGALYGVKMQPFLDCEVEVNCRGRLLWQRQIVETDCRGRLWRRRQTVMADCSGRLSWQRQTVEADCRGRL